MLVVQTHSEGCCVYEGVGFDLGETLIEYEGVPLNWEREYPNALAAVAAVWAGSPTPAQIEAGSAILRCYNTRLVPRRHEIKATTLFGELLTALGAPPGQTPVLLDAAVDAFFGVFSRRARTFPDVAAALEPLIDAGVPIGVLTDVPYGMPRRLVLQDLSVAGLDSLTSATLTSTEVGVRKPEPAGFRSLADAQGCAAEAMLYVGNEQKDVTGAHAAGMTAALIWRNAEPAPAWGQNITVSSMEQLLYVVLEGERTGV